MKDVLQVGTITLRVHHFGILVYMHAAFSEISHGNKYKILFHISSNYLLDRRHIRS